MSAKKVDENDAVRKEAHMENEITQLRSRVKTLEYDCAELVKQNDELGERVSKLASRQPAWPKGYRPHGRRDFERRQGGQPQKG
jgi:predicted RNase H-like nuclease (RuvC/YqgF family)